MINNFDEITPELSLWKAVVDKAIRDALWKPLEFKKESAITEIKRDSNNEVKGDMYRLKDAVNWINSNATYFNSFLNIIEYTGHHCERIRKVVNLPFHKAKEYYLNKNTNLEA